MAAVLIRSISISRSLSRQAAAAAAGFTNKYARVYSTVDGDSSGSGRGSGGSCSGGSSNTRKLEGKVALITGGASGIGKATATEFIKHGAQVMIADLDTKTGPETARELGVAAEFVRCDVGVEEDIAETVEKTVARHGKLDVMFNNAGIVGPTTPPSISELDMKEFEKLMKINVFGVISGIKHAAKVMIPAGSGCILCTSSIAGVIGGFAPHSYTIAKFTIPGIVKSVASELCDHGVRINCISPGTVATPLTLRYLRNAFPTATEEKIREKVREMGVLNSAECEEADVANAALYLASDDGKYVSGHNLVIDGGLTSFKKHVLSS